MIKICFCLFLYTTCGVGWAVAEESGGEREDQVEVGYKNGLYFKRLDNSYLLKMQFLFQPQYQYENATQNVNTFFVKRAQMRFSGHSFGPRLKYKVMFEMPGTKGGTTMTLRDLWISWQCTPQVNLRVGQFFVFFDMENLQPSWSLQFVDRSIVNANLGFERDLGTEVYGQIGNVSYHAYVMNGDGRNQRNRNTSFFYGGRLTINLLGNQNYLASDLAHSQTPHLLVGLSALYDPHNAALQDHHINRFEADAGFRYEGFSVLGFWNVAQNTSLNADDSGVLVQGGYVVVPNRFEVVGRWAKVFIAGALGKGTVDTRELGGGVNVYFDAHRAKLQSDFRRVWHRGGSLGKENELRTQVQMFF